MQFQDHNVPSPRIYPILSANSELESTPFIGALPELLRAFRDATGYDLQFSRRESAKRDSSTVNSDVNFFKAGENSFLSLRRNERIAPKLDRQDAEKLVEGLVPLLEENYAWRSALVDREGELAAFVSSPIKRTPTTPCKISIKLRKILRVLCKALEFDAASLYLLDVDTTSLKLRSLWGLPDDRYLAAPRPLSDSRTEIEAFMGNVVVLREDSAADNMRSPEDFVNSVCVPVASDETILGALWLFVDNSIDIGKRDLEIIELAVGRLVDVLERETEELSSNKICEEESNAIVTDGSSIDIEEDELEQFLNRASVLKTPR